MKSLLLLLLALSVTSVLAANLDKEIPEFEEMSRYELLKHAELDNLEPKANENISLKKYIKANNNPNRIHERYTDRFLAKLVVIINRAPKGTARDAQTARVYIDGVLKKIFKVSTGKAGYESRIGYFRPVYTNHLRVYDNYYSSKYKSLMAKAIFYSGGFAIHHTDAVQKLGQRASHGCVRFHIDDITYISDEAMKLGNNGYQKRSWSHANLPRNKKNVHFKNLERSDVHPISRRSGKIDFSKTTKSLDMVILVKDQRNK